MKFKKSALIFITLLLLFGLLSGCNGGSDNSPTPDESPSSSDVSSSTPDPLEIPYEQRPLIRIASLKGPTGMGMVKLFSDNENKKTANRYETSIVNAPDEIVAKITTGEIDIAAVPTNLAATLYNKTNGNVKLLALNTLGVLYIMEKGNEIQEFSDLEGKTIYASGQGSTPEFILNYLLIQNGLTPGENVTIEYKSEHSELATLALTGNADVIMIPEPFVTNILAQNAGFRNALDLTEEWNNTTSKLGIKDSVLSMGGLIVRKEFLENNKDAVDAFLDEYKNSIDYVNANLDNAAALIEQYEIMPNQSLAKLAIPRSNIVFIEGEVMKNQISNLYNVLFMANPLSLGGSMPEDDFYYIR